MKREKTREGKKNEMSSELFRTMREYKERREVSYFQTLELKMLGMRPLRN